MFWKGFCLELSEILVLAVGYQCSFIKSMLTCSISKSYFDSFAARFKTDYQVEDAYSSVVGKDTSEQLDHLTIESAAENLGSELDVSMISKQSKELSL